MPFAALFVEALSLDRATVEDGELHGDREERRRVDPCARGLAGRPFR